MSAVKKIENFSGGGTTMEEKVHYLQVDTPDGIVKLKISRFILGNDDEKVVVSTFIQEKKLSFQAETTETALILLAKELPKTWKIKSCLSCRFGHFCPVGNCDNELFCVTEFEPKEPCDLWHVTEDDEERRKRSRTLFDCCECYKEQSKDYFTYSDFYFEVESR